MQKWHTTDAKSRRKRIEEVLTDAYSEDEELEGFRVYLENELEFPFVARIRGEKKSREMIVSGLDSKSLDKSVVCKARIGDKKIKIPASEIESIKNRHNGVIIGDYQAWLTGDY